MIKDDYVQDQIIKFYHQSLIIPENISEKVEYVDNITCLRKRPQQILYWTIIQGKRYTVTGKTKQKLEQRQISQFKDKEIGQFKKDPRPLLCPEPVHAKAFFTKKNVRIIQFSPYMLQNKKEELGKFSPYMLQNKKEELDNMQREIQKQYDINAFYDKKKCSFEYFMASKGKQSVEIQLICPFFQHRIINPVTAIRCIEHHIDNLFFADYEDLRDQVRNNNCQYKICPVYGCGQDYAKMDQWITDEDFRTKVCQLQKKQTKLIIQIQKIDPNVKKQTDPSTEKQTKLI